MVVMGVNSGRQFRSMMLGRRGQGLEHIGGRHPILIGTYCVGVEVTAEPRSAYSLNDVVSVQAHRHPLTGLEERWHRATDGSTHAHGRTTSRGILSHILSVSNH